MTGEYKLLNGDMEKKNQRLAKDISENRIEANLKILKENKLAFGIWFASFFFSFFLNPV